MNKKLSVYFDTSIKGKQLYSKNYEEIIKKLEANECDVVETVISAPKEQEGYIPVNKSREIYNNILKKVAACDFMVAEVTQPSPGVTMVIQDAIHRYKKPVLVLYHENKEGRLGVPFTGNPSRLLNIKKYNFEDLDAIIKDFTFKIRHKIPSSKFTLRLDEELDEYLDYMKLKLKETSKNQTVLAMLRKQMELDDDYSKFAQSD